MSDKRLHVRWFLIQNGPISAWRLAVTLIFAFFFTLLISAVSQSAPLPQGEARQRTVEAGETLSEIAKENGIPLADLMLLNGIADANAIYQGQILYLPPIESSTPISVPLEAEATELLTTDGSQADVEDVHEIADQDEEGQQNELGPPLIDIKRSGNPIASLNRRYTVQFGDTIDAIALRNGVSSDALRRLNGLQSNSDLVSGQELLLPAAGSDLVVERAIERYKVASGENLSQIARDLDVSLQDLLKSNAIVDANAIVVGQDLIVPGQPVVTSDDPRTVRQIGPPQTGFFYYTVQAGDTLSEIARDFETPMLALLEYNNLPDEQTVYAGLELRIPFGPASIPQTRPPTPHSGTSFVVSLSRQQCWVLQGERIVHSWNCSTGYGEWITRTGSFQVQTKLENAKSGAYRLDMPYWLGIYDVGEYENGIHGLPVSWETGEKLWDSLIGEPATFGCAMLGDGDAETLFDLAYLGMPVHVVE